MTVSYSPLLDETCERLEHPSGLVILHFPKTMTQNYAMLAVRYGAADTVFGMGGRQYHMPQGIAHFLEHKLFARPDGGDANEQFSTLGAEANAWTDYDRTAYLFSTTEKIEPALSVLMNFVLDPYFTPDNVAREQGIIREEILMGEDDPWQQLHEQTMRAMYTVHPLRERICGTVESMMRITADMLYDTYRAHYRPENMYLVVCGNISMAEIFSAVEPVLVARPRDLALCPVFCESSVEPAALQTNRVIGYAPVAQPLFQISAKDRNVPLDAHGRLRREVAMSLLGEVLFSRAGVFYHDLFERGILTPNYSYGYSMTKGAAYYTVSGDTDDPEAVCRAYHAALRSAKEKGLAKKDIERCRRVLYAEFVAQFDFPDDIAELVCEAEGNGYGVFDELGVIADIKDEELYALLKEVFIPEATVLSVLQDDTKEERA